MRYKNFSTILERSFGSIRWQPPPEWAFTETGNDMSISKCRNHVRQFSDVTVCSVNWKCSTGWTSHRCEQNALQWCLRHHFGLPSSTTFEWDHVMMFFGNVGRMHLHNYSLREVKLRNRSLVQLTARNVRLWLWHLSLADATRRKKRLQICSNEFH